MRGGRAAAGAAVFLLALVAMPAFAAAAGTTPILSPNPSSDGAQKAAAATGANQNGYAEVLVVAWNITTAVYVGGADPWQLRNYSNNPTDPFGTGLKLVGGDMWINRTTKPCSSWQLACGATVQCDGTTIASFIQFPQPLYYSDGACEKSLYINWTHTTYSYYYEPLFTLTRLYYFTHAQDQAWSAQGVSDTLAANLTFYGKSLIASPAPNYTYLNRTWWWVPYPTGAWISADTTVTDLSTGLPVPATNYTVTGSAFLLQWNDYPSAPAGSVGHYSFYLLSTTGGGGGSGGSNSTGGGNTSTPGGGNTSTFPNTPYEVSEVVLAMGNVTPGFVYYEASAVWENFYSYSFNGTFFLEGSWIGSASSVTLYANGVAIPSYEYIVSSTSIVLFPGYVTAGPQQTVNFVAHYSPTSSFRFLAPLGVIDGVAVPLWGVILAGGVGIGVALAVVRAAEGPKARATHIAYAILAVWLFSSALVTMVTLR